MSSLLKMLKRHLDGYWPENKKEDFVWATGPIRKSLPDFLVRRIEPLKPEESWVYLSLGAWQIETCREYRTEFLVVAPQEDPIHVETLAMVAHFHADPKYKVLDIGSVLEIGRPWIDGATCDHLLVSLPYPFGPKLEICHIRETLHVRFFWLLPITRREKEYVHQYGSEALEKKLDAGGIDYLNPKRPSMV